MASYSMWRLLENWVLKTRFISLYITKQQHQQKPAKMKSDLEGRKKKKKDKGEEKTQKKSDPIANLRLHDPGCASPRSRDPGPRELFLSLSLIWSPSLSSDLTLSLSLIWSDPVRWGCAWDLKFFKFFWFINRVLETRFWSDHHVEKNATSDVIRP